MRERIIFPFDTETVPFSLEDQAPPLVCLQYQDARGPHVVTRKSGALDIGRMALEDDDLLLVGHNAAYDMAVFCREGFARQVVRAYEMGRVHDTYALERLGEIAAYSARKKLDLGTCCKAHGIPAPSLKDAGLQTDFAQFLDADEIPEPHRTYALEDLAVGKLYERQRRRFRDVQPHVIERMSRLLFWTRMMSNHGLRTSPDAVEALRKRAAEELAYLRPLAEEYGFVRPNGTRSMKTIYAALETAYGDNCPRTPTGRPQTNVLALAEAPDPRLQAFAHYGEWLKIESADVPMLQAGILHPKYGIADTGRTTCSKPNVQNLPGKGGIKECIRPPEGFAFLERDYSGIELCTFAQTCVWELGRHTMADYINTHKDPAALHAVLGARLLRCSTEEFLRRRAAGEPGIEDVRTRAKNAGFGFIGGLGYKRFVDYVRLLSKGKIILTLEESRQLKEAWAESNPDGPAYLQWVADSELHDGTFEALIPGSGILRRGMWYSAAANCRFSGLAAAIMNEAGWRLMKWRLFGGGPAMALFCHDAFIVEAPIREVHETDVEFERILREAAADIMPDVITKTAGHAADRYTKNAHRVVREGKLQVWTPETRT